MLKKFGDKYIYKHICVLSVIASRGGSNRWCLLPNSQCSLLPGVGMLKSYLIQATVHSPPWTGQAKMAIAWTGTSLVVAVLSLASTCAFPPGGECASQPLLVWMPSGCFESSHSPRWPPG